MATGKPCEATAGQAYCAAGQALGHFRIKRYLLRKTQELKQSFTYLVTSLRNKIEEPYDCSDEVFLPFNQDSSSNRKGRMRAI